MIAMTPNFDPVKCVFVGDTVSVVSAVAVKSVFLNDSKGRSIILAITQIQSKKQLSTAYSTSRTEIKCYRCAR